MELTSQQKVAILHNYPWVHAVYNDIYNDPDLLVLVLDHNACNNLITDIPLHIFGHRCRIETDGPFTDLRLRTHQPLPRHLQTAARSHRQCHDEPIPGGVQIQPHGANWVGTMGTPCSFQAGIGPRRWGLLSNWHVLASGQFHLRHPIHQPDDEHSPIAKLSDYVNVVPDQTNLIDAAVADAYINGLHTVADTILAAGPVNSHPVKARPGLLVHKSGRTTALTYGRCKAIRAAVRVSYGTFTAIFADQDLFEPTAGDFSAPGDSGSLIFTRDHINPVALLFAGADRITVGNPIHAVIETFHVKFHFNQEDLT
jgi:hypothetical protein